MLLVLLIQDIFKIILLYSLHFLFLNKEFLKTERPFYFWFHVLIFSGWVQTCKWLTTENYYITTKQLYYIFTLLDRSPAFLTSDYFIRSNRSTEQNGQFINDDWVHTDSWKDSYYKCDSTEINILNIIKYTWCISIIWAWLRGPAQHMLKTLKIAKSFWIFEYDSVTTFSNKKMF